jgi:hypothetical protein
LRRQPAAPSAALSPVPAPARARPSTVVQRGVPDAPDAVPAPPLPRRPRRPATPSALPDAQVHHAEPAPIESNDAPAPAAVPPWLREDALDDEPDTREERPAARFIVQRGRRIPLDARALRQAEDQLRRRFLDRLRWRRL